MNIKLHKNDLPKDLDIGNKIAIDCEFMGLNFLRDKLCLVQISSGNSDAHIVQLDRTRYNAPNLKKILSNNSIIKIFHYARADLVFIKKYLEVNINNIEDTKLQSKLIRKLTEKNLKVTAVTRNLHQKGYILKTQANPGYLDVVECNIFDINKIEPVSYTHLTLPTTTIV